MELLNKLIREINELPRTEVCSVCLGQGDIYNSKRRQFFDKYSEDAFNDHSKFNYAEQEWVKAEKPKDDKARIFFLDIGLTNQEAIDLYALYLTQPEIEKCHNCDNGKSLTEHGKLVNKLRNAILDL